MKKFILLYFFSLICLSQNTIDFELIYNDYTGQISGQIDSNVSIPVQAIFYQQEGNCGQANEECSAFIINSQDPQIDINYTIRELDNVVFDNPVNNDFTGNGSIGYEDLLGYGDFVAQYNIFPSDNNLTSCDFTPLTGSQSFSASSICKSDLEFIQENEISSFIIEMTANLPTECGSNTAVWFLQFNFLFEETVLEISTNENNGETNIQVNGGIPPYTYQLTDSNGNLLFDLTTSNQQQTISGEGLQVGSYTVAVYDDANDIVFDSNGDGLGAYCSEDFTISESCYTYIPSNDHLDVTVSGQDLLLVPINTTGDDVVTSYQFNINYDPAVLQPALDNFGDVNNTFF